MQKIENLVFFYLLYIKKMIKLNKNYNHSLNELQKIYEICIKLILNGEMSMVDFSLDLNNLIYLKSNV